MICGTIRKSSNFTISKCPRKDSNILQIQWEKDMRFPHRTPRRTPRKI
jgi:hypothetical protein